MQIGLLADDSFAFQPAGGPSIRHLFSSWWLTARRLPFPDNGGWTQLDLIETRSAATVFSQDGKWQVKFSRHVLSYVRPLGSAGQSSCEVDKFLLGTLAPGQLDTLHHRGHVKVDMTSLMGCMCVRCLLVYLIRLPFTHMHTQLFNYTSDFAWKYGGKALAAALMGHRTILGVSPW